MRIITMRNAVAEGISVRSFSLVLFIAMVLALSMSLGLPHSFATNNQTPNTQILNSNTSSDNGAWERFSVTTAYGSFSIGSSAFTFQLNQEINNCGFSSGCSKAYWVQAITGVDAGSLIGKSGGYWAHDIHLEEFWGSTSATFCSLAPNNYINIDQNGYASVEQATIANSGNSMTLELSVLDNTGTTVGFAQQTCSDPTSGGTTESIQSFQQEEGVVAGCGTSACGTDVTFSPSSTEIFNQYIDMISNYNSMSSSSKGTQTAEGSNLYQQVSSAYSETYGSMYLYTVQGDETT
ncbi:MAG: hypothetical protein ACREBS_08680 [Nitrososphaerales archaeon]